MDTHSVLVLTVIIMSIVIVVLLSLLETSQQRIRGLSLQLEESSRRFQREKYRNLLVGSSGTKLENTKESQHTLQHLYKMEPL
mgnify:CR=1 FL=1